MKTARPTEEQMISMARKIDIVTNMAGEGEQQINVLIYALAIAVIDRNIEIASVINMLTLAYLANLDDEEEDDDDDY